MNALATLSPVEELDHERWAAVHRLDDDLRTVAAAAGVPPPHVRETLAVLRRRCTALYRTALLGAAGVPHDRVWTTLALSVAAFVSCVSECAPLDPIGKAAEGRLRALASD
jgi:hypothetical protein